MSLWKNSKWEQFWEIPYDEDVQAVLLTTYGFDPKFLWEQLLPNLFYVEYDTGSAEWYMSMKDNLKKTPVVVFCDAKEYAKSGNDSYPVFEKCGGYIGKVCPTQHSKLWIIKTNLRIRIAIGSCNLTRSAFQNQIQYVWMRDLKINKKEIGSYENKYLSNFISSLFASASTVSKNLNKDLKAIKLEWCKWTNLCIWPNGIKLIASIPNSKPESNRKESNKYSNGLLAMSSINDWLNLPRVNKTHLKLYVQVFSTFEYNEKKHNEWLENFKKAFGGGSIIFRWPSRKNIKAYPLWEKMELSCSLLKKLKESDDVVDLNFNDKHIEKNQLNRLPHGKFYSLWNQRKGYAQWSMIGSSNFSPSAWGWGFNNKGPRNYELNVIIKHNQKSSGYPIFQKENTLNDLFCKEKENDSDGFLYMLYAYEEDKKIKVDLFVNKKSDVAKVVFTLAKEDDFVFKSHEKTSEWHKHQFSNYEEVSSVNANIFCNDGKEFPTTAKIRRVDDSEMLFYDLFLKYHNDDWKNNWLLQRYGWKKVKHLGDYQVTWMVAGSNAIQVVDQWNKKYDEATTKWQKEALIKDANDLIVVFDNKINKKKDDDFEWLGWEIAKNEIEILLKEKML